MPRRRRTTYRLADVSPAASVRVEYILFGVLRDLCYSIGLREGDRVQCRDSSPQSIVLIVSDGRRVIVDPEWARFISVSDCEVFEVSPRASAGASLTSLERGRMLDELGRRGR